MARDSSGRAERIRESIAFISLSPVGIPLNISNEDGAVLAPLMASLHCWATNRLGMIPKEGEIAFGRIDQPEYFVAATPLFEKGVLLGNDIAFTSVPKDPLQAEEDYQEFQQYVQAYWQSPPPGRGVSTGILGAEEDDIVLLHEMMGNAMKCASIQDAIHSLASDALSLLNVSDIQVVSNEGDVIYQQGEALDTGMPDGELDAMLEYSEDGLCLVPDAALQEGELGERMRARGIFSLFRTHIRLHGEGAIGYVGFDERRELREWSERDIGLMMTAAEMIGGLVIQQRETLKSAGTFTMMDRVLNHLDASVYIADLKSYTLLYVNEELRRQYQHPIALGVPCYKAMHGLDAPCDVCPRKHLSEDHQGRSGMMRWEYYNQTVNRWFSIIDSIIPWIDGKPAHLECAIDIHEKKLNDLRIERMLYYDDLLAIPNRLMCRNRLDAILIAEENFGSVVLVDMDDFKYINDVYGHDAGDALLQAVTRYFQSYPELRSRLYRFGGDEYVFILDGYDRAAADAMIERILSGMPNPWLVDSREHYCTVSIGVVEYPKDGTSGMELLKNVEIAMVQAKAEGKNQTYHYTDEFNDRMLMRLDVERQLRKAVDDGCRSFVLHYQPEFDLLTGRLIGAEALIRWEVDGVLVPPNVFVSIAEMLGLIVPMGQWALEEACRQAKQWQEYGLDDFFIAVNLSVRQFSSADFIPVVVNALQMSGLAPECLILEITESMAMSDFQIVQDKLAQLREMGIRTAMDDFGTGYSSLANLRKIPLDIMKLDRLFIEDIEMDLALGPTFLSAVIELAHSLNLQVCCEGIENQRQVEMLRAMYCDVVQGFYLGRPLEAQDFELQVIAKAMLSQEGKNTSFF